MKPEQPINCPFCGGEAKHLTGFGGHMIYCIKCQNQTETWKTQKTAFKKWNTRSEEVK